MSTESTPTFADKVNNIVGTMTQADDGTWQLPDEHQDLDEATKYAVTAERRFRDTQSAYTKARNQAKALETENAELAKGWERDVTQSLTVEQNDELAELKVTDPDAWRDKMNEYEELNRTKFGETRKAISAKAAQESELDYRTRLLEEHNEANPGVAITDDVLENDIPPRYLKQLEKGEIDFTTFLSNVTEYLTKGKVIAKGDEPLKGPNLGAHGGGATPTSRAVDSAARVSYTKEIY